MRVAIVNYGMGNLSSVRKSFEELGANVVVVAVPDQLYDADAIVLPGVGAFAEGMENLVNGGWVAPLRDNVSQHQKPLLGICLGMQMLADHGNEGGITPGLGLIPGTVQKLDSLDCKQRIPHIGWNEVHYTQQDPLFDNIQNDSDFYFVHSYAFVTEKPEHLIATVPYDVAVTAVVRNNHIYGCQFHPEKSSKAGRRLLSNFMKYSVC